MEKLAESVNGSCLCGGVTFTIKNNFEQFHFCHCVQCQKTTGSAHASNLFVAPSAITWVSGTEDVTRYDLPGRRISNAFCKLCGSRVPYLSLSGETLVVPAGTLEGTLSMSPRANIFWPEKAHWYQEGIQAPQYETYME